MLINRIGTFFILLGLGLTGLFILSDIAQSPSCGFLIFGVVSLGLGVVMWFRNPRPPAQPSGRFRILKSSGKKQPPKK